MNAVARACLTLCVLLGLAPVARAYVVNGDATDGGRRWPLPAPKKSATTNTINPVTGAIRFTLAGDGFSGTNAAAELDAVRAAFAQWQAVPGTLLRFEDAGCLSPPEDASSSDGVNLVYWEKRRLRINRNQDYLGGRTGYTLIRHDPITRAILEADIVFNAVEKQWTTDCGSLNRTANPSCIGAVALHEIGHFIGLGHSPLGGATMFFRAAAGDSLQAGLSADDIAGVRSLYPRSPTGCGAVAGQVLKNGRPVFGAAVFAHDAAGGAVAGTLTGARGDFLLSMLMPGNYTVHAAPLDPPGPHRLCAGADIAPAFSAADTQFQPTPPRSVKVAAGRTNRLRFSVADGPPAFRITGLRVPTGDETVCSWSSLPVSLRAGQSNLMIGVASATLPTNGATLTITGDGLTLGPPTFLPNAARSGLNFISAAVSVAREVRPGLRTFIVRHGTNTAYAHGFLEIKPAR